MIETLASIDFLKLTEQALLLIIGAALVLANASLAERRRVRSEHEAQARHEQSMSTGLFAVRNLLVEQLNEIDSAKLQPANVTTLAAASATLHRLIDKSEPSSQWFTMAMFNMSMRLDDFIAFLRESDDNMSPDAAGFMAKYDAVMETLVLFDLATQGSFARVSADDLAQYSEMEPSSSEPP